jgi:hypothetical protein
MTNFSKRLLAMLCLCLITVTGFTQQVDLFKMQDSLPTPVNEPVINTFFATRMVNSHTVEILGPGSMDFRINHRFAPMNTGIYDMFGLDIATMRMSFDFGITKNLMVGVGRSTHNKEYDWFAKYRIMHQKTGKGLPMSIDLVGAMSYQTIDMDPSLKMTGSDRTFYTAQVLMGSKLSEHTSIQVSPTYTHYNRVVGFTGGAPDLFSIGFLARQKVSKRISINVEYFLQTKRFDNTYDPLSIGIDINTGGHVFQLHFTNSTGMNEHTFIHETTGSWSNGDIRMGFNLSRIFNIGKKKTSKSY